MCFFLMGTGRELSKLVGVGIDRSRILFWKNITNFKGRAFLCLFLDHRNWRNIIQTFANTVVRI